MTPLIRPARPCARRCEWKRAPPQIVHVAAVSMRSRVIPSRSSSAISTRSRSRYAWSSRSLARSAGETSTGSAANRATTSGPDLVAATRGGRRDPGVQPLAPRAEPVDEGRDRRRDDSAHRSAPAAVGQGDGVRIAVGEEHERTVRGDRVQQHPWDASHQRVDPAEVRRGKLRRCRAIRDDRDVRRMRLVGLDQAVRRSERVAQSHAILPPMRVVAAPCVGGRERVRHAAESVPRLERPQAEIVPEHARAPRSHEAMRDPASASRDRKLRYSSVTNASTSNA
jgi:hypothetical protein